MLAYSTSTTVPEEALSNIMAGSGYQTDASYRRDGLLEAAAQSTDIARKVGEGVLSGVKALGDIGYAYWSARGTQAKERSVSAGAAFSRSAPASSSIPIQRARNGRTVSSPQSPATPADVGRVALVDLVKSAQMSDLSVMMYFRPARSTIALLSLSPMGHLLVANADASAFDVFEIRPRASGPLASEAQVWHRYRLHRGLTPASAQSAFWSANGRLLSVTTTRGTNREAAELGPI